ncbi:MAG: T9SS type A sorting domain-containing protein [Flavobacterium sp.]|uniref:T9SS type A sorting domain-containing protein n=1 Tax=Flavobacterium sp. TaxID=239 RepID=UPI001217949B|nr:T9SS type A sorting domain-containing protein [Flavobacterium sp.]RZJ66922.1 MAG: T9SS type A sorting domain-containing protein [Flavobacterium sp.]
MKIKLSCFFVLIPFAICAQIIPFTDPALKSALLVSGNENDNIYPYDSSGNEIQTIDTNGNGEIEVLEVAPIHELFFGNNGVVNLGGLEQFPNLKRLRCEYLVLATADLSLFTNLELFKCYGCNLNSINVAGLSNLLELNLWNNEFSSLPDFSGVDNLATLNLEENNFEGNFEFTDSELPALKTLLIGSNALTSVAIQKNALETLIVRENDLAAIDLSGTPNLLSFICTANSISSLDMSAVPQLVTLNCSSNNIVNLDLSALHDLNNLSCSSNPMVDLNIKNGKNESTFQLYNLQTLQHICADASQLNVIQNIVNLLGYANCDVDASCNLDAEENFADGFLLYPNPVRTELRIETNETFKSVAIYDSRGRLVLKTTKFDVVDVSDLTSGLYYAILQNETTFVTRKFIKQ